VRPDTLDLSPASQQQLSCYAAKVAAEKFPLQHQYLILGTYKARRGRSEPGGFGEHFPGAPEVVDLTGYGTRFAC
jgi:hypothetical protein